MSNKSVIQVFRPVEKKDVEHERDLYWYDIFYKKMNKYVGIRLDIELVTEEYIKLDNSKNIPLSEASEEQKKQFPILKTKKWKAVVTKAKPPEKKEKTDRIRTWFDTYQNYSHTNAEIESEDGNSVFFSVPEKELNNFLYYLQQEGFNTR